MLCTAFQESRGATLLLFVGLEQLYPIIGRLEHLLPDKASKFIGHPHAGSVITGFSADLAIPAHPQTIPKVPAKRRRTSPSTDSNIQIQQGKTTTPPPPPLKNNS